MNEKLNYLKGNGERGLSINNVCRMTIVKQEDPEKR